MKEVVISKSAAVKDKVNELVTQASPGSTTSNEFKHVASSDRYGKRLVLTCLVNLCSERNVDESHQQIGVSTCY